MDGQINDQYCSEAGSLKFLRNIVLLPGCGQFLPEASFLVRPATERQPDRDGAHFHGRGGRRPHDANLRDARLSGPRHRPAVDGAFDPGAPAARNYESLSLTVTSVNKRAVELYEHLGFRTVKTFAAGVWNA